MEGLRLVSQIARMSGDDLARKDSKWEKLPQRPRILEKESEKGVGDLWDLWEPDLDLFVIAIVKHNEKEILVELAEELRPEYLYYIGLLLAMSLLS